MCVSEGDERSWRNPLKDSCKKKPPVLYSLYLSVSISIFLSVEGSRSVQQPAGTWYGLHL